MNEYGAVVGRNKEGKTDVLGEKPVPLLFCP